MDEESEWLVMMVVVADIAVQAIISMNGYQLGNKFLQVSFKKQK